MITTLTGENSFSLNMALKQIIDSFVARHGELVVERIDGEEIDFSDLQQTITAVPFLADRKLIILKAPSKNKKYIEQSDKLLSEVPSETDIVIVEPKLDKRLSYYKFLKQSTDFKEFQELDTNSLTSWLSDAAKQSGGSIKNEDTHYLIEKIGPNQQLLASELEKLILYNPAITKQSIDLLVDPNPQSTVFQLIETVFGDNNEETLSLYSEQRALKVEPQQIIAMLTWQLHILAILKVSGEGNVNAIAQEAGISPYVIRKSQYLAKKISLSDLKERISDLVSIDKRIKSTLVDPDEILKNYLVNL